MPATTDAPSRSVETATPVIAAVEATPVPPAAPTATPVATPAVATPDVAQAAAPRRRMPRRTLFDFVIDLGMLVAFRIDYSYPFTGLAVHEWVGLMFVVLIPLHLVQHWDWVVRTTRRLRHARRGREALRWLVDLMLMPTLVLCVASGVMMSHHVLSFVGITTGRDRFWRGLHSVTADMSLAIVAFHVALSWRWIWSIVRRLFSRRSAS